MALRACDCTFVIALCIVETLTLHPSVPILTQLVRLSEKFFNILSKISLNISPVNLGSNVIAFFH